MGARCRLCPTDNAKPWNYLAALQSSATFFCTTASTAV